LISAVCAKEVGVITQSFLTFRPNLLPKFVLENLCDSQQIYVFGRQTFISLYASDFRLALETPRETRAKPIHQNSDNFLRQNLFHFTFSPDLFSKSFELSFLLAARFVQCVFARLMPQAKIGE
jgi:hypothetical protein